MAKRKPKAGEPPAPAAGPAAAAGETRTARVTLAGHGQSDVEFPADHPSPTAAAVEAYKALHGLWSLPEQPHVELDPEPAAEADDGGPGEGGQAGE